MATSPLTPSTVEQAGTNAGTMLLFAPAPKTSSHTSRPLKIRSSWISAISYRRVDGVGFLAVFVRGDRNKEKGKPASALLYGPSPAAPLGVPAWVAGLVQAGVGGVSVRRAYGKVVKRHQAGEEGYGWGYQRVEGEENLKALKEMMK